MSDEAWTVGIRCAGAMHLVTVALAHFTPIRPRWDENLARLPEVHRRFAVAQNAFIGLAMIFAGVACLGFARDLASGSRPARIICAGIALWWGGRLVVLPWLGVWPELKSNLLRGGFVALHAECATFAVSFGWLALRPS